MDKVWPRLSNAVMNHMLCGRDLSNFTQLIQQIITILNDLSLRGLGHIEMQPFMQFKTVCSLVMQAPRALYFKYYPRPIY